MEKIYDYVMGKLYNKIYPVDPSKEDIKIFKQSVLLSWTKLKHFFKTKKEYVLGSFENDVLEYFKLLDVDKSPRKKFIDLNKIFDSIKFLLVFNGKGSEHGVDDQLPILNYVFIKAQPLKINSIVKFMDLYIGNKKKRIEGSQLTQFEGICKKVLELRHTDLIDVTLEEFTQKCNEATKEIKY